MAFAAKDGAFTSGEQLASAVIPLATAGLLLLYAISLEAAVGVLVVLAAVVVAGILFRRVDYAVTFVFLLIAWFPEYSQTEWDVWSAQDAPSIYNFRPIPWITASVFDYLFLIVVIFWLARRILPDPSRLLKAPFARPFLAFLAMCTFCLAYGLLRGNEVYYALREFRVSSYFVIVYLMFVTTMSKDNVLKFVRLILFLAFVVAVFGMIRHAMGIGKSYYEYRLIYYDIADSITLYIAMLLMVSLSLVKRYAIFFLISIPIVYVFVFSFRRSAWVGFAVALLFLFFPRLEAAKKRIPGFKLALVAGLLLTIGYFSVGTPMLEFVAQRIKSISDVQEEGSNVFRLLDALNALNAFAEHPVLGVGYGGRYELKYYSEAAASRKFWENVNRTSHNGYLFVLYKMGLVGFATYLILMIGFFLRWRRMRRTIADPQSAALYLGLGASFVAIMVTNLTGPVTDSIRQALLLAFVMALVSVLTRETEPSVVQEPEPRVSTA